MSLAPEDLKLIGGSDGSALVGLNPFKTPHDIFARIVEGKVTPDTVHTRRGRIMEAPGLAWYAEDTGAILRPGRSLRDSWKRSSLDGEATRDGIDRVVEVKTANIHAAARYGDGPDDVPLEHIAQVTWYMGETGIHLADIAALLGGAELRIYTIHFDAAFYELLIGTAEKFWKDHILTGIPPPLDGSTGASEWLTSKYPANARPVLVPAPPDAEAWAARMQAARDAKDAAKLEETLARQHLEALIADADGMTGDGWRVSWKRAKSSAVVDYEAAAKEYGVPEDIIQKHTTIRPGARVFRPTWSKK